MGIMSDEELSRVMARLARKKWASMTEAERRRHIRKMVAGRKRQKKSKRGARS